VFGCGEPLAPCDLAYATAAAEAAFGPRADRLRHTDGLERDTLDWLRERQRRARAWVLRGVGAFGLVRERLLAMSTTGGPSDRGGRLHRVESTSETVKLGVFDCDAPNLFEIDSGDTLVYHDTWSHFLNRLQPGASVDDLARWRREGGDRGPHSVIGPIGVRGAAPGDVVAIRYERLDPVGWGASFVNPGALGTGTLASEFPQGQVRYLTISGDAAEFLPGIDVPIAPFQGTFGVAPASGGVVSSVPPGPHGGNIDLRDLTVGTTLYLPVWQPSAKLYTGDSHATQGDGEVNNQALESAMREVRVRVSLHPGADWQWPMAETADHWICMAMSTDLNEAFRQATLNVIDFLALRADLSRLDAYSLASIAIHFRVTQFVNRTRGVHAMVPKQLFSADRRAAISVV
jgi:acetamidase/formamidase